MTHSLTRLGSAVVLSGALLACSTSVPDAAQAPTESRSPSRSESGMPTDAPSRSPEPSATSSSPEASATRESPSGADVSAARRAVQQMTLAEKAGQVIVTRYSGTRAPTDLIETYHLGGVIVMGDNVASVPAVRAGNTALQRAHDEDWPLFIGVDQEGGVIARLGSPMTAFPAFMTYGAAGRPELARAAALASGQELRAAGFTVVFAPVADVTIGPADPTIGSRSAGADPEAVAQVVTAAVDGYESAGIIPVVKHFPGHGALGTDSHVGLPVQDAALPELRRRDLRPFRAAVAADVSATMVGHIAVRAVDPGVPATLSRPVVSGLLRRGLGFYGVVVSDAMEMGAVVDGYGVGDSAVQALRAGVDVLLMPPDVGVAHAAIMAAVRDGRLSRRRLDQAATRVVAALLEVDPGRGEPGGVIGSHDAVSLRASRAAITVVDGPCSGRLVGDAVLASGDPEAVTAFNAAASAAGLATGSGDTIALLGYGAAAASADVVVATDTPYVLTDSRAAVARIATYGETPGAMRALVEVLLGRAPAPGRLPVPVSGVPSRGC
ncbi:MAG: beta-N-acetylhexosaminidase [Actinomycetota bacterium]|nr:beta-N-acetylhexosaminidase [Actinomycetota bacterium]